ncbi:hypothetical protein Tco_1578708 [Tanacetum coccineum]
MAPKRKLSSSSKHTDTNNNTSHQKNLKTIHQIPFRLIFMRSEFFGDEDEDQVVYEGEEVLAIRSRSNLEKKEKADDDVESKFTGEAVADEFDKFALVFA